MNKKLPCFVALDFEDEKRALDLAEKLRDEVLGFKVGPRLYFNSSASLIKNLSRYGEIFLDFKFYDIPSTMEASVRACFDMGVKYLTVHASAGKEALTRVSKVEKKYKGKVLAVSVLTSEEARSEDLSAAERVQLLAQLVQESELSGLVSSAQEVAALREKFPSFYLVTPGIRLKSNANSDDQKRVATPEQALLDGADALVIGRPIIEAENPLQVCQQIKDSLKESKLI